jgi:hypothetical protein
MPSDGQANVTTETQDDEAFYEAMVDELKVLMQAVLEAEFDETYDAE